MRVVTGGPRWILAVSLAVFGCSDPAPRSVILISIDTLRADHLGSYGHERPTSPHLDALAAEGVLFENALATSPWTLPSHASLLTGLYPHRHGVRTRNSALPTDVVTVAETLAGFGFETAAIVNSIFLTSHYGMARGFQHFESVQPDHSETGAALRINERVIRWMEGRRGRPVFLFVHYYDVHSDYRSLARHERSFTERRSPDEGSSRQIREISAGGIPATPELAEQLARLYDGGIRQLDEDLGRLLAWLEDHGWLEETLLIITSDHGEEFFEHGGVSHGHSLYEELLRVPLILRGPSVPSGVRISEPASLIDVVPTALRLLNVPAPPDLDDLDGRDLSPLWSGDGGALARPIFAEVARRGRTRPLRAVREGRHKLIVVADTNQRELYDLREDPQETRNLAGERPDLAHSLELSLNELLRHDPREAPRPVELRKEHREQLRALGYD